MRELHRRPILYALVLAVGIFLILPTVVIITMSLSSGNVLHFPPPGFSTRWYSSLFGSSSWMSAAATSAQVAVATAALATILGTLAALGLVRGRLPGKSVVNALVLSPLLVPLIALAVGMFLVLSRWHLVGTLPGLIAAHTVLGIPFVVVNVATSLKTLDPDLEAAARNLGASPARAFLGVTLPLIRPAVFAGALFAFITSWDEVIIAIFLTSPVVRTLPVVMWGQVRTRIEPTLAAVSAILTGITVIVLLAALLLQRSRQEAR